MMRHRAMVGREPPSLQRRWSTLDPHTRVVRSPLSTGDPDERMERLWSQADATVGNRRQMRRARKGSNKQKPSPPVATSCRGDRMVSRRSIQPRQTARTPFVATERVDLRVPRWSERSGQLEDFGRARVVGGEASQVMRASIGDCFRLNGSTRSSSIGPSSADRALTSLASRSWPTRPSPGGTRSPSCHRPRPRDRAPAVRPDLSRVRRSDTGRASPRSVAVGVNAYAFCCPNCLDGAPP